MKKILAVILLVAAFAVTAQAGAHIISNGTAYTNSNASWCPAGWSVYRLQYTFGAAVTDTAFFIINPGHPYSAFQDTLVANIVATVVASDSSNIQWEVWSASDTTGFWKAAIGSTYDPKIFKKITVARDSATNGTITRILQLGSINYGGWVPYKILVGYGAAAAVGGTANSIGNVLKIDVVKP